MLDKICPKCQVELRCKENGVYVVECCHHGMEAIWHADLWYCTKCGIEVVLGLGKQPIAVHYKTDLVKLYWELQQAGNHMIFCWLNTKEKEEYEGKSAMQFVAHEARKEAAPCSPVAETITAHE